MGFSKSSGGPVTVPKTLLRLQVDRQVMGSVNWDQYQSLFRSESQIDCLAHSREGASFIGNHPQWVHVF
jgi:hypothetical protein